MLNKYFKIFNILGYFLILLGVVIFLPIIVALSFAEKGTYLSYLVTSLILIAVGIIIYCLTKDYKKVNLEKGSSALVVLITWILAIFLSVAPFMINGKLNFSQAIFESTSAWTTTGFTVVNLETAPNSLLFLRSLIQFVGGIGIVLILLFILPTSSSAALFNAELHTDKIMPNIKKTIKAILIIYCSYLIIGTILLCICGMSFFDALNHSMTALATGGFSTKETSIGYYDNVAIEAVLIILMLAGMINFAIQFLLFTGKFKMFAKNSEIRLLPILILIIFPILAYGGLIGVYKDAATASRIAIFELVSAMSTTGFTITDYSSWPAFPLFVIIFLMIVGGHSGSTSGGIKQSRFTIMLKSIYWQISKHFKSDSEVKMHYIVTSQGKYYLKDSYVSWNNTYILLYIFVIFFSSLIISIFGYSFKDSFFEAASLLGNIGISIGVIGESTPLFILWLGSFMMLFGRLEFLVIFIGVNQIGKDIVYNIKKYRYDKRESKILSD